MFKNYVNRHDVGRLYRRTRRRGLPGVAHKLRGSTQQRVIRQWSDTAPEPTQWWAIPAVRQRWNRLVTGDAVVDFPAYVAERYLRSRSGLRALSLGCGMGGRELRWAELGVFDRIDAFDIAPAAVEAAAAYAKASGYADAINFEVRDFTHLEPDVTYDVVLAEHSLHHLAPMPDVVARIERLLTPDGLFVVDEFVGPTQFQWTDAQLAGAQAVLDQLPRAKRVAGPAAVKESVFRPSRLWMHLTDPSEAIESALIIPTLRDTFDVLEELPYGGAVLHIALADIAQNFLDDAPATTELLERAFAIEDRLMQEGAVGSDFMAFVCRVRAARP